jgi:hypothetical protein
MIAAAAVPTAGTRAAEPAPRRIAISAHPTRPKIDSAIERNVRRQLAKGLGVLKVARSLGIGTGTVQRISKEGAMSARWLLPLLSPPLGGRDPIRSLFVSLIVYLLARPIHNPCCVRPAATPSGKQIRGRAQCTSRTDRVDYRAMQDPRVLGIPADDFDRKLHIRAWRRRDLDSRCNCDRRGLKI